MAKKKGKGSGVKFDLDKLLLAKPIKEKIKVTKFKEAPKLKGGFFK